MATPRYPWRKGNNNNNSNNKAAAHVTRRHFRKKRIIRIENKKRLISSCKKAFYALVVVVVWKGIRTGQTQTGLGPRVYPLTNKTAVLPGSDIGSDGVEPASSFVIQILYTMNYKLYP